MERLDMPHRLDSPDPARAPRRSAASVASFSVNALLLGGLAACAAYVGPARMSQALDRLTAAGGHLLTAAHLPWARPLPPQAAAVPAPLVAPPVAGLAGEQPAGPPGGTPGGQSAITYGDRLKVTFFESVAVPLGDPASRGDSPGPVTIFPRMDLSGEYVVDEGGGLDIPRLGWRAAAGQGAGALQAGLATAFRRAFGRPGDVHVAVLDRRPVYVLGGPRGGTTIRHAPGLIVLQALAEAGGYQRDAQDTSRAIEAIRENQRLGEAQDRLLRALVRQARLTAMRDGLATVTLPPAAASVLAETLPQDVAGLLREAEAVLAREERAYADQVALAERQVSIARMEAASQDSRATQARALAESKASRLRGLEWVAARGSVSQFKLMDAVTEVAEAAARQEDQRATVAQAQSRVIEAEIGRARLVQARAAQVTLELAAAVQETDDLRRAVTAMRAVVAVLGGGQAGPQEAGPGAAGLRITRRGPDGPVLLAASETTPLMPGDVLQIGPTDTGRQARPDAPAQPPRARAAGAELTVTTNTLNLGEAP